MSVTSEA